MIEFADKQMNELKKFMLRVKFLRNSRVCVKIKHNIIRSIFL